MTRTLLAAALAALSLTTGCAQNPPPAQNPAPSVLQPAHVDSLTPLAIRPGDMIRIVVWGHQELSGEFPIDENYDLLFPLIGAINVRTLSVAQLRERLNTELSQLFQRPFLSVTPLFRVAVLGQVLKPGLYSVDPTLSVYDLLALAGGLTQQANQNRLQLIRGGENIRVSLEPSTIARATLRELGVHSGDQLIVARNAFTREDLGLIIQIASFILLSYTVVRH